MKKVLLLFAILIVTYTNAQDKEFISSLNNLAAPDQCLKVANQIANLQSKKVRLLNVVESKEGNFYFVRFVPEAMTNKEYENLSFDIQSQFLTVKFYFYFEGFNKDLEIEGLKKYKFKQVTGTYLQLFDFWKQNFKSTAEKEVTLQNEKLRKFKDIERKLDFYFDEDNDNNWIIRNVSY